VNTFQNWYDQIMRASSFTGARLKREARTLLRLIDLYCRAHHGHDDAPCLECVALQAYALERLSRCIYQSHKPACSKCPHHCYRQAERMSIRRVMRYAGPRLIWYNPVLSSRHLLDRFLYRNSNKLKNPGHSLLLKQGQRE